MNTNVTNADRAEWATEALRVFTARTFGGDQPESMHRDDLECAVTDLITDLLHYTYRQDFDTAVILGRAHSHFITDMLEEARRERP